MNSHAHANGQVKAAKPPAVALSDLPSAKASELEIVPANPVEYTQTAYLNFDEWRGGLTLDAYLDRETYLQEQDLTKDNQITGWILTSPKLPPNEDGDRSVLAACETLLTHAYTAHDGKLDKILAHAIGSVFTRPEHRGKGYAGRMMTELGKRLETWQQPNGRKGTFSVLYSDIGQKFYSKFGWRAFKSTHILLQPVGPEEYRQLKQDLPEVHEITAKDLRVIPTIQYLEEELQTMTKQKPDIFFAAVRPDVEHFDWHHAREEFVCKAFGQPHPSVKGAIHKPTGVALIWCRVYASKAEDWQLHILHTVIPPKMKGSSEASTALSALLLRAQFEAHEWNMVGGVEVWDPSELVVAAAQRLRGSEHGKVEVISRDTNHVCSLRWIGPGSSQDQEVVWVANEKYAWC